MPSKLPLILLPPSEGKAHGGDGPSWAPGSMSVDLDDRRLDVLHALGRAMSGSTAERSKLLGVKGDALDEATLVNQKAPTSPTMRAVERYSGVLYGALDATSLPAASRRRLGSSVLVVSGLWGLVAPVDPIPDYKLKMGAVLPGLGRLSTWWRDDLTSALVDRAAGRVVWNLLPNEHDAAWRSGDVASRHTFTVRFWERRPDGSLAAVSHWNKFLKGALVRFLLAEPHAGPDDLARWEHPSGYRLDRGATLHDGGVTTLSFVREPG